MRRSRSSSRSSADGGSRSRRCGRGDVARPAAPTGVSSGTAPEPLADHQPPVDQLQAQLVAVAQHRPGRLGDLGQPGQRPPAQDGQGLGQADRLDDVRAGDRQALVAQHAGDARPASASTGRSGGGEQVVVPAGRVDAGAVALPGREPAVRPRHPGHRDLGLRQSRRTARVGARPAAAARCSAGTCQAPQTTATRSCCLAAAAQHRAHVRLAPLLVEPFRPSSRLARAPDRRHRLGDRLRTAPAPRPARPSPRDRELVLDDVLPPPLRVVVAGRLGQQRRSGRRAPGPSAAPRVPWVLGSSAASGSRSVAKPVRRRQVEEAHRDAVRDRPAQRLPLRGELGERPERRAAPRRPWRRRRCGGVGRAAPPAGACRPRPASADQASASGGPSISTTSGRYAASAGRTARAEPGPWWRTPSRPVPARSRGHG